MIGRRIVVHEWRVLQRERVPAAAALVVLIVGGCALANGHWTADAQHSRIAAVLAEERERLATLGADAKAMEAGTRQPPRFRDPSKASWAGEFLANRYAVWPVSPLAAWASGQRDLMPSYFRISMQSRETFIFEDEIENPLALALGRFDLAFVIVFLVPLLVIAVGYDLLSGEREAGTLSLVLAQPVRLRTLLAAKAVVRGACCFVPIAAMVLADRFLVHRSALATAPHDAVGLWMAGLTVYVAFWVVLCVLVNGTGRAAAACATWLVGAWMAFVLIVPALIGIAAQALHPTPTRLGIEETARELRRTLGGTGVLLRQYYERHAELRPATDDRTDWAPGVPGGEQVDRDVNIRPRLARSVYTLPMEPTVTPRALAIELALTLARAAVRDYQECFWTRAPQALLETRADVVLVVRRLRQHGPAAAWRRAREIEQCL